MRLFLKSCLILFFYCQTLNGHAQNNFQILFKNPLNDCLSQIIEDNEHNYIAIVNSVGIAKQQIGSSSILRISFTGDTISKCYRLADSSLYFGYIEQLNTGNYKIIGGISRNFENDFLLILEYSPMLELISRQIIPLPELRKSSGMIVKKFNGSYYVLLTNSDSVLTYMYNPYLIKLDGNFEVINTKYYPNDGDQKFEDFIFSPDSSQIWAFGQGFYDLWGLHTADQFVVYDTSLNLKYVKQFPDPNSMHYQQVRRITDTTFIHSCNYLYGGSPQDDDVVFTEMDSTLQTYNQHFVGEPDTSDYGGFTNTFDFVDPDSIFYSVTKNIIFDFWPQDPNWILTGRFNRSFQTSFQRIYGGDAYYITASILCTSDGGYLIGALRYDYTIQDHEHDVFFLKLNAEGLITGIDEEPICPKQPFAMYPNPGESTMHIVLEIPRAQMIMSDIYGRIVMSKNLFEYYNTIDCSSLSAGTYIIQLINAENKAYTQKWIKK